MCAPVSGAEQFSGLHGIEAWVRLCRDSSQGLSPEVGPHFPGYQETAQKEAKSKEKQNWWGENSLLLFWKKIFCWTALRVLAILLFISCGQVLSHNAFVSNVASGSSQTLGGWQGRLNPDFLIAHFPFLLLCEMTVFFLAGFPRSRKCCCLTSWTNEFTVGTVQIKTGVWDNLAHFRRVLFTRVPYMVIRGRQQRVIKRTMCNHLGWRDGIILLWSP